MVAFAPISDKSGSSLRTRSSIVSLSQAASAAKARSFQPVRTRQTETRPSQASYAPSSRRRSNLISNGPLVNTRSPPSPPTYRRRHSHRLNTWNPSMMARSMPSPPSLPNHVLLCTTSPFPEASPSSLLIRQRPCTGILEKGQSGPQFFWSFSAPASTRRRSIGTHN